MMENNQNYRFLYDDVEVITDKASLVVTTELLRKILSPSGLEIKENTDRIFFQDIFYTVVPLSNKSEPADYEIFAEYICFVCAAYSRTKINLPEDVEELMNGSHVCGISQIDTGQWRRNRKNKNGDTKQDK